MLDVEAAEALLVSFGANFEGWSIFDIFAGFGEELAIEILSKAQLQPLVFVEALRCSTWDEFKPTK
jgi:hypothetical protein